MASISDANTDDCWGVSEAMASAASHNDRQSLLLRRLTEELLCEVALHLELSHFPIWLQTCSNIRDTLDGSAGNHVYLTMLRIRTCSMFALPPTGPGKKRLRRWITLDDVRCVQRNPVHCCRTQPTAARPKRLLHAF